MATQTLAYLKTKNRDFDNVLDSISKQNIIALTTTRTVTPGESGTWFTLDATAGAFTVTLPGVSAGSGCRFRFINIENTPSGDITIASDSTNVYGTLSIQSDTNEDNRVALAGSTNVLFDTTCLLGDWVEFVSNGTYYFVSGMGSVQGAFTVS